MSNNNTFVFGVIVGLIIFYVGLFYFLLTPEVKKEDDDDKVVMCRVVRENLPPIRAQFCSPAKDNENLVRVQAYPTGEWMNVHESRIRWERNDRLERIRIEKELIKPHKGN